MFLPLLGVSALVVLSMRYRRSGWTTEHIRNDLVAVVLLAAVVRIVMKVVAL